jgi:hypothetical protein
MKVMRRPTPCVVRRGDSAHHVLVDGDGAGRSRKVLVLSAVLLIATLALAGVLYVGVSAAGSLVLGEDACSERTVWGQDEHNGMLHQSLSLLPPGVRCTWTTASGEIHSELLAPW